MPRVEKFGSHLVFECPGCRQSHGVTVEGDGRPRWTWNGSLETPTLVPSISVRGTMPITDEQRDRILAGEKFEPKPFVCHSFVKEGFIQFLDDCTHEFKNRTVMLPEVAPMTKPEKLQPFPVNPGEPETCTNCGHSTETIVRGSVKVCAYCEHPRGLPGNDGEPLKFG